MMAPTRLWPLAVTPILSPWGKLRAALEYFIPPRAGHADESMAAFVRRRLGREAFDRLVEPLVSAVYAADLEKLSVLATLSRFREMECEHGSLIRAMRRQMRSRPAAGRGKRRRYSMFVTLEDGLSSLVEAIAARLPASAVRLDTPVTRLEPFGERWRVWAEGAGGRDQGTERGKAEGGRRREAKPPDQRKSSLSLPSPSPLSPSFRRPDSCHALAGGGRAARADG